MLHYLYRFTKIVALCCTAILSIHHNVASQVTASFTSNVTSGCAPLTVQFTNLSTHASSYHWDFGNGLTSMVSNPVITFTQTGNITVKLTATGANGADSVIMQNYIQVAVKPVVQFLANPTAICQGASVQFQNQTTSFDSCLWDFGDGVTSSLPNPGHTYQSAGQFSVTLIAYHTGSGCTSSLVKQNYISVWAQPQVNLSVDTNTSCVVTKAFQFSASSAAAGSFQWDFGDGNNGTGNQVQHSYAQPGVYTIQLSFTSTNGCIFHYEYPNYITVLNSPKPVIYASDTIGCHPVNILFNTITNGATSLVWDFGNATGGTQSQMWANYSTAGIYPVHLTVTYSNGCSVTSAATNIVVNTSPSAAFTTSASVGCLPLNIQFTAAAGVNVNYLWKFGDGDSSLVQNPSHIYTENGFVYPTLTVHSSNGCTSTFIPSNGIQVRGSQVDFSADKTTGCNPLMVNFSNLTSGTVQWLWNFGNGDTSTSFSPGYLYTQQGTYAVQLICADAFGCRDTLKKTSYIHVGGSTNNFISSTPVTGCAPFTVHLNDSSVSSSWLWDFDDGNTSTSQNPTHTFSSPGTYVVSLETHSSNAACSQIIPDFRTYIIGGGEPAFSYSQTTCPPYIGYFTDSSINAVAWHWNFGDGSTSLLQNPVHTYAGSGSYHVSLTTTTADGCSSTATHQYAMNFSVLGGNAVAQCNDSVPPLNVQFHANSQGATSWLWTFGDGDSSALENPLHSYASTGPFTITLTVANDSCSHSYSFPPTEFGSGGTELDGSTDTTLHSPNYDGCAPLTINFHNPKLQAVAWHWDFGDGHTSASENPENTYEQPGTFDVMLWVTYADGSMDTIYTPNAVTVAGAQTAFSVVSENTCSGVTIQLLADTGSIQAYEWDFGDGTTSNLPQPTHTFTGTNNYIISLNAVDSFGCISNVSSTFYADYSSPIQINKTRACAADSVLFSVSNINYQDYLWRFGDGDSASGMQVFHAYADSGKYTVSLTVTDAGGCENTYTFPSYVEIDKPVADFVVSSPISNCSWVYLEFTNQSTGSVLYHWSLGDGSSSTQTNVTKYYYYTLPNGYYDVTLTATKNGCSSIKTISNAVYIPEFYADFTYSRSNGCLPITISLTDSSHDVARWEWQFGDGDTSFVQHPVHTFITEPPTRIKLIAEDVNGCKKIIEKDNITLPTARFGISDSAGCSPFTMYYSDASANAASWFWNFGDGLTSQLPNPQHTYTYQGIYSPSVIITDDFGCSDTLVQDSLIAVTSPVVNFGTTTTTGCAPVIANFQNLSAGNLTYLWNFGDSSVSTQENPSHIYSSPGIYAVTLKGTDAAGCTGIKVSGNLLTVPGPKAQFNFATSGNCAPVVLTVTDSSVHAASYFWSFSDGDSSKLSSPIHSFTEGGIYQVTLIVKDSSGCPSIFTHPDLITVHETPVAGFTYNDSLVCIGTPITFTNTTSGANLYHWDFGDGSTSSQIQPIHSYNSIGPFGVKLVAKNGICTDSTYINQAIRNVKFPIADFTADITEGCNPLTVYFQNQTTQNQNTVYRWEFGNGISSWNQQSNVTYTTPGTFNVKLVAVNEGICADSLVRTNYIHVKNSDPLSATIIHYATVLNDSMIRIQWQNSAALNLDRYELYRSEGNGTSYKAIFVATSPQNTSLNPTTTFIDSTVDAATQPYSYKVKAINNCDHSLSLDSSANHATIYLHTHADTGSVALQWTSYEGCLFDIYHIYRSEDGNSFDLIGQTSSSENQYSDSTAYCSHPYFYRVEATDLCQMNYYSESNIAASTPVSVLETQTATIIRTTVENNENTLTEWIPPSSFPEMVTHYFLYRSTNLDSVKFDWIATFDPSVKSYKDFDVDLQNQNYFYRIEPENICGIRGSLSAFAKTILLKGELNSLEGSTLKWTPYEGWKEGVDYYELQQQDQNGIWKTIRKVNGNITTIEDN